MKVATIIQARMASTRLPGKVMAELRGKTVLARVVERVRRSKLTGDLVVATTMASADDVIVEECRTLRVKVFRGSQEDVLDRYYRAAKEWEAEIIIRVCSDCPLIEPEIIDRTTQLFLRFRPDYASNTLQRTYPRGLDVEIMTRHTLNCAWGNAEAFYQRSHVTPFIYENPDTFDILHVRGDADYADLRWTLDTAEDLAFIRAVYDHMPNPDEFFWNDVLDLLKRKPELIELNQHVLQKALQEG